MHFLTMHPTRSCLIPQTFVFCVFCPVCSRLHKTSPTTSTPRRRQWQEDFGKMFAYFLLKFRWQDGNQSICSLWWIWSYTSQRRHTHHLLSLWIHKSNPPQKSTPMRRRGQKSPFPKTETSLQKVFETETLTFFNKSVQTWKEPVPDSLFFIEIRGYSQQPLA